MPPGVVSAGVERAGEYTSLALSPREYTEPLGEYFGEVGVYWGEPGEY